MIGRKILRGPGVDVEVFDVGDPLNSAFLDVYVSLSRRSPLDWTNFDRLSEDYLVSSSSLESDDAYFNNLSALWRWMIERGLYLQACNLWEERIEFAERCEDRNPKGRIHKGTPYYFLGYTHIVNRNPVKGFLAMHRAFEEDLATHGTLKAQTPALSFVKLDFEHSEQFARDWVRDLAHYLDEKLETYRAQWGGALTLHELRDRFLQRDEFREEAFSFTFHVASARELEDPFQRRLLNSEFGANYVGSLLFQFTLVADQTIGFHHPNPHQWHFFERLIYLHSKTPIGGNLRSKLEDVSRASHPPGPMIPTLRATLDGSFVFRSGTHTSEIEKDFLASYLLRNRGAHSLEPLSMPERSYGQILQRVLNVLFASVEFLC